MTYDPHYHPYPSYRVPVYAKKEWYPHLSRLQRRQVLIF